MFDLIFDAVTGFHQAAFLVGATLMLGIAAAILADFMHWRLHAKDCFGEIVAFRTSRSRRADKKGGSQRTYFPIIEYLADDGRRIRAHTRSGSSRIANRLPGMSVPILVKHTEENVVRIKGSVRLYFAAVFAGVGLLLLAIALTQYRTNAWTIPCVLAFAGYGAFKLFYNGKKQAGTGVSRAGALSAWKARKLREMTEECDEIDADEAHEIAVKQDRQARKAAPVFGVVALGMLGVGYYFGHGVLSLELDGLRAPGEIARVESRQSTDSEGRSQTMYYPVVSFRDQTEQEIEFTSKFGSSSTPYRRGDPVEVLYSRTNPHSDAMIDRGLWNWAVPGGLTAFGLLILFASIQSFRGVRNRTRDGRIQQ